MRKKFYYAFSGLVYALKHRSIQLQVGFTLLAIVVGIVLRFAFWQWAILLLCIGLVLAAEICNTCIEALCDLYTTKPNPTIGHIKDMAAGGVLVCAIVSLVVGVLLVWHQVWR